MSLKQHVGDLEELRQLGIRVNTEERVNQRITSQELTSLKHAVKNKPVVMPLRKMISGLIHELIADFVAMAPRLDQNSVCKRYGHKIDLQTWTGVFPKCRDCGKTIREQIELRSALPKLG